MGQFRVIVTAVGNHGCQREVKDGGAIASPCTEPSCTDCIARRFVAQLKAKGASVEDATIQHWPGTPGEVKDDLLSGTRTGSF